MADENYNSCGFDGDVLGYLYDEVSEDERGRFESHLEACETCVSEFALLSDARYSVYEWKLVEFAPMETPEIVIPVEPVRVTWFDAMKAAFAFPRGLVTTGAAFATIVLAVTVGVLVLRDSNPNEVVQTTNTSPTPKIDNPPAPAKPSDQTASAELGTSSTDARQPQPVKASVSAPRDQRTKPAAASRTKNTNLRNRNVPTLNEFDDEEDKSLRLAQLFDDLDTRDLE